MSALFSRLIESMQAEEETGIDGVGRSPGEARIERLTAFIDTNVLLDVLARREPFHAAASRIWTLAEHGSMRAFVSAVSFDNVYYIIRKAAGQEQADLALRLMRDIFQVVAVDERILHLAIDDRIDDFEDAIQFHSAIQSRAPHLGTRNPTDFPAGAVAVLSPDEYLALVNVRGC